MPCYSYKCTLCSHNFDEFHKISERRNPLEKQCPKCMQKDSIQIQITAPAIVDPYRAGITKLPADYRKYVLGKIKSAHPKGNVEQSVSIPREL